MQCVVAAAAIVRVLYCVCVRGLLVYVAIVIMLVCDARQREKFHIVVCLHVRGGAAVGCCWFCSRCYYSGFVAVVL